MATAVVGGLAGAPLRATGDTGQAPAPKTDAWAPLRYVLGQWQGESHGQPGRGSVRREYRFVLGDQFIEVRNTSTYEPQAGNPKGEVHEDIGYISVDRTRKTFVFRQFHVEGFVNTYVGTADANGNVVFTSEAIENIPAGWRARETYRKGDDGTLIETFELAEPKQPFTTYSTSRLTRVP